MDLDVGRLADAVAAVFDDATGTAPSLQPGEVHRLVQRLTASMRFTLSIPGTHYSGLSNQAMLEVRQREGRDFAANTRTLRAHVASVVQFVLEGATRLPTPQEIEHLQAAAVLEWVLKRIDYLVRDVRIPLLTPRYQQRKRAAGYFGPVGVRTGAWRDAVARASVEIE